MYKKRILILTGLMSYLFFGELFSKEDNALVSTELVNNNNDITFISQLKLEFKKELFNRFGEESLSEDIVTYVKSTADKMSMQQIPLLRKMNVLGCATYGIAVVMYDHLYINEAFFNLLTHKEREFLIGHELIHFEKNHHYYKMYLQCGTLGLSIINIYLLYKEYFPYKKITNKWLKIVPAVIVGQSLSLVNLSYSRMCEREADREAAIRLGDIQGGIEFFKRCTQYMIDYYKNMPSSILRNLMNCTLFSTHPSFLERINYLEMLKL